MLGDVEELWECHPEEVLAAYPDTLALEAEFHKQGRYRRFWGNHDDHGAARARSPSTCIRSSPGCPFERP